MPTRHRWSCSNRETRRHTALISLQDLDTRDGRGLERKAVMSLALGDWIENGHGVLITGPTGAGKVCVRQSHLERWANAG